MNPKETLYNLGLEEKEATIYLALLGMNEASVLQIAKKSGIKRPTVYVVLASLEEKGFVSRTVRGKKTLFSAQHPKKLITEAELNLTELQGVMPQLEALFHKEEGKPRVMIYEGKENLDRAFDEAFVIKGEVVVIGTLALSKEVFPRTFKKAAYTSLSNDFSMREIIDENEESRKHARSVEGPHRKLRFLTKEMMPFETDIGIFGNHVLITSVKKEYFTVSIESTEIANAFRTIFNVMWAAARE